MNRSMHDFRTRRRGALAGSTLSGALLAALFALGIRAAPAEQMTFETPEAAVEATMAAIKNEDREKLIAIFGKEHEKELLGTDEAAGRDNRAQFYKRYQEMHQLLVDGEDRRILVVGSEAWPVPIPLVKEGGGWRWDTATGIEEMLNRRVGENELTAIGVLEAYVDAQVEYASVDRDGDQVREYAQRVLSTEGTRDGLYWKEESEDDLSPFGPLVADARDYLSGRNPGDPYFGYYFKVITRQGENVPGGRYDYIINGNMIAGFAMVAFPADYGFSGVMTFLVNQQGQVMQKDLGEEGDILGAALDEYNPDSSWSEPE